MWVDVDRSHGLHAALLALKVIKLQRVRSFRAIDHLRIERESLERVTAARVPFVCTLSYAFASGSWLVLAIPFFSGGVLEVHIEERGAPPENHGLPMEEVRFLAAQMVLALEGLRNFHRDSNPGLVSSLPLAHPVFEPLRGQTR